MLIPLNRVLTHAHSRPPTEDAVLEGLLRDHREYERKPKVRPDVMMPPPPIAFAFRVS